MNRPRILLAAANSGAGKTTITCGLLQAFKNRGQLPAAFKCGPDYIDPMFHREVIGTPSYNLDPFLLPQEVLRRLFYTNASGAALSILEGVMGYYDGIGFSDACSSYTVASQLETPVLLIVNAKGSGLSLAAQIKGFLSFRPNHRIAGVLLNRLAPKLYPAVQQGIEQELGIPVLGYLPNMPQIALESRHLGLVTAQEVHSLQERVHELADQMMQTVDLERIWQIAQSAPVLSAPQGEWETIHPRRARIAVAKDKAFCFYYEDALRLLETSGAELVPFSPLQDAELPPNCGGLYLGGGYPELYAEALEQNNSMRASVLSALKSRMPCVAECGGFLYLHDTVEDTQGIPYKMVGFLKERAYKTTGLRRFGYVTMQAQQDTILGKKGMQFPAHEFHYWDSSACGEGFTVCKASNDAVWQAGCVSPALYAGFPHIHFCSNPSMAASFVEAAAHYQRSNHDD